MIAKCHYCAGILYSAPDWVDRQTVLCAVAHSEVQSAFDAFVLAGHFEQTHLLIL
jgi:hypothetical protein